MKNFLISKNYIFLILFFCFTSVVKEAIASGAGLAMDLSFLNPPSREQRINPKALQQEQERRILIESSMRFFFQPYPRSISKNQLKEEALNTIKVNVLEEEWFNFLRKYSANIRALWHKEEDLSRIFAYRPIQQEPVAQQVFPRTQKSVQF